ncbi:MAG: GDP-L-fucose synthase [Spirochaetia bacterium]|nr:GDP-L-fucose synthase [Spirochaetia bacterium]
MNRQQTIFVAGHHGLVGSAVLRRLKEAGYHNIITRSSRELDLTRQQDVEQFFAHNRPDQVYLCAAKVGGIGANSTYPAQFIYENLMIESNVIHSSYTSGVKKLLFMGSSCIYPRSAPQPMKEEYLLTGPLEVSNEAYAIAKIAGIRLCKHYNDQYGTNFISVMPTNQYGPGDPYDLQNSHVLPALIRKFHEAKMQNTPVTLWGDGPPLREFMYSDDLADASVYLMEHTDQTDIGEFVNVGTAKEISIRDLAQKIAEITGFQGEIIWDTSKPNGTPRKLLDVSRLSDLGWTHRVSLTEGLSRTYADFLANL